MTNSDYMGGHLAGLKPKIRPSRTRGIIPTRADPKAWTGKTENYQEKDCKHYELLAIYGPQDEYIHPKLRK